MVGLAWGLGLSVLLGQVAPEAGVTHSPPPIPRPQPIVAIDDLRTDGPVARYAASLSVTEAYTSGPDAVGHAQLLTLQGILGPTQRSPSWFEEIAGWTDDYSFRARFHLVIPRDGGAMGGPMTYGLQRYFTSDTLAIRSLLNVHVGVEGAFATPWISGRDRLPPEVLRVVNGVDTELAGNGWSIRPASGYIRADFMACRNKSLELGVGPELFVPTQAATTPEYDLRFRGRFGLSFACSHRADSWSHPLATALEYRGRVRLHAAQAPASYYHLFTYSLQYHFWRFTLNAFVELVPYPSKLLHYGTTGVQLQFGI